MAVVIGRAKWDGSAFARRYPGEAVRMEGLSAGEKGAFAALAAVEIEPVVESIIGS